jgi:hypothetical protein
MLRVLAMIDNGLEDQILELVAEIKQVLPARQTSARPFI